MSNTGSLTMGFARVNPRQLAPTVGTTQVGIKISAARIHQEPDQISLRRSRSQQASLPRHQDHFSHSRAKISTTVVIECTTGKEEIDDPKERREASTKESHSTNRNAQRRPRRPFDDPSLPTHPPLNKMTTMSSRSATS